MASVSGGVLGLGHCPSPGDLTIDATSRRRRMYVHCTCTCLTAWGPWTICCHRRPFRLSLDHSVQGSGGGGGDSGVRSFMLSQLSDSHSCSAKKVGRCVYNMMPLLSLTYEYIRSLLDKAIGQSRGSNTQLRPISGSSARSRPKEVFIFLV